MADEEGIRTPAARTLAASGYRVLAAPDAAVALALAARELVDPLLTDVVMPGLSGYELVDRMIADQPGLAVLLMSGSAEPRLAGEGVPPPPGVMLRKPVRAGRIWEPRSVRRLTTRDDDGP